MPTTRRRLRRVLQTHSAKLTFAQTFELIASPCGRPSAFASDEARREAWQRHRERLTDGRRQTHPGRRLWAWWNYDSAVPRDLDQGQAEQLLELGELDAAEEARVQDEWRIAESRARSLATMRGDARGARCAYECCRESAEVPDWFTDAKPGEVYPVPPLEGDDVAATRYLEAVRQIYEREQHAVS